MLHVKLKITGWLRQSLNVGPTGSEEMWISVPEGESVLGMARRLASERGGFWNAIFDEKTQAFGPSVLVVLNGSIVNPYDRTEGRLRDGDELLLLPTFDGG